MSEQFARSDDLHRQIVLFDHELRPNQVHEFVLADGTTPTLHQRHQGIKRSAARF
jgi:hypothetical protein